jgi:hypothetical protein
MFEFKIRLGGLRLLLECICVEVYFIFAANGPKMDFCVTQPCTMMVSLCRISCSETYQVEFVDGCRQWRQSGYQWITWHISSLPMGAQLLHSVISYHFLANVLSKLQTERTLLECSAKRIKLLVV